MLLFMTISMKMVSVLGEHVSQAILVYFYVFIGRIILHTYSILYRVLLE